MGGWGLKFSDEALQKNRSWWGFIFSKSYVTPTFFKL